MSETHTPVLCDEVLSYIKPKPDGVYVDATIGLAGHSLSILKESSPTGQLLGIDKDENALAIARKRLNDFQDRSKLIKGNFLDMQKLMQFHKIDKVDGVLFDLGVSSLQLDTPERGFSFQHLGPLDMRMDRQMPETAAQIVNDSTPETLTKILLEFGEERLARRIVQKIVASREVKPITNTLQLARIVTKAVHFKANPKVTNISKKRTAFRIHPATRVFQALRIAVNDELNNLKHGIEAAISVLKKDGCICVISFHSLEDRIVKQKFRKSAKSCICSPKTPICICDHKKTLNVITKHPILPNPIEIETNPRARSAKMRVAVRV